MSFSMRVLSVRAVYLSHQFFNLVTTVFRKYKYRYELFIIYRMCCYSVHEHDSSIANKACIRRDIPSELLRSGTR